MAMVQKKSLLVTVIDAATHQTGNNMYKAGTLRPPSSDDYFQKKI